MNRICVTDFEATCWQDKKCALPDGRGFVEPPMEIIEIGSVMVDGETYEPLEEFQRFVRPMQNPTLSDFCRLLTSITQDQVDKADRFATVLMQWKDWMRHYAPEGCVFASWGRYDYNQLAQDCEHFGLVFPKFLGEHLNVKTAVAEKMGWKPQGVGKALARLGMQFEGTPHRGIDDTRNIVRIMRRVLGGGAQ